MKNKPNQNEFIAVDPPQAEGWDEAWLLAQCRTAQAYHELGMLDEAEAALQLPVGTPEHWGGLTSAGLGLIAWARGDMQAVVDIAYPWRHLTPQRQIWFGMVAAALKNCGRIPEAIALQKQGIALNGLSPNDCYNLACFYTQAHRYEEALAILLEGLSWDSFDRNKALVDSDLQPLWTRLPELCKSPHFSSLANSLGLILLADHEFQPATMAFWDPVDRENLPAAFGRYLVYYPATSLYRIEPSAPGDVRRNFKDWTHARARTNLRLVRRAVQHCRIRIPPPHRSTNAAPSIPSHPSKADVQILLALLEDPSITPEERSEIREVISSIQEGYDDF